jgi:hypothetical protein
MWDLVSEVVFLSCKTYATLQGQERSPLVEVPWTHPPFIVLENMAREPEDFLKIFFFFQTQGF